MSTNLPVTQSVTSHSSQLNIFQVEKSLQRINRGTKNAMYTSQKSIENKVGSVAGWKDLLMSVGFRFEPAANGIPSAVFFPQTDPGERLTQCSASLQAVLGLSPTSWAALASLLASPDSSDEIMAVFRQVIGQFGPRDLETESVKTPVNVRLWRVPGCHELLASLGFDLLEVGKDEVTLKTSKTANKRQIQFALQALVALFDTDEAPRSLAIDCGDSLEEQSQEEEEEDDESSDSTPPDIPPFPAPRKSNLILDGSSGAFSSYARSRGEPDGRQQPDSPPGSVVTPPPPPLPPLLSSLQHHKGRESDCNFTPSPVENLRGVQRYLANYSTTSTTSLHSPRLSSTSLYSPKTKLGPSPLSRPESCSSAASSAADWEHQAGATVRRNNKLSPGVTEALGLRNYLSAGLKSGLYGETPDKHPHVPVRSVFTEAGYYSTKSKLLDTARVSDKLSIRAEVSKPVAASRKKEGLAARLEPGVTTRIPPTGSSQEVAQATSLASTEGVIVRNESLASEKNIKEHIINNQMRKINRELPISEVYHERSLGLGLAPPLSKLIMSNNIAVAQVDHHQDPQADTSLGQVDSMSNFDNLSVIEEALTQPSKRRVVRPPVPPKPAVSQEPWLGLMKTELKSPRDEGDGRSMTDSQYSGCSPSTPGTTKDLVARFHYGMKMKEKTNTSPAYCNVSPAQNIYSIPDDEPSQVTTVINTNIHPSDVASYINTEFHNNKDANKRGDSIHTLHPQIWSKDKNGRFTYNGSLASDC